MLYFAGHELCPREAWCSAQIKKETRTINLDKPL